MHTDAGAARARAAAALRRLGHALIGHHAEPDLLERVADAADQVASDLEAQSPRERDPEELERRMFDIALTEGEHVVHFDECFVSGPWNPMGIAMDVHRDGRDMVAGVTLGPAFEGAPGRAHGGIVAALCDDILGYLLTLEQAPGFTGELTVRFLAPTPVGQPLTLRARVGDRENRKLWAVADVMAGGAVVATAEALFVLTDASRLRP